MPRIAGIEIPANKQIKTALTYVYGIGISSAGKILKKAGIDPMKKTKDLAEKEIGEIRMFVEKNYKVEGDLKRETMVNIKRLKDIRCWRGLRHLSGLPARGQKTRKNSRTIRGNIRKTVSAGRKTAPAPK